MNRGQEGSLTLHLTVVCAALFVVAGLALDGGSLLAARRQAIDEADAAARAGAQAVAAPLAEGVLLDVSRAEQEACAFIDANRHRCTATAAGSTVTVTVTGRYRFAVLPLADRTVTATGRARAVRGVTRPDP